MHQLGKAKPQLLLIGGGHSHILLIKNLIGSFMPWRVRLINPTAHSIYSGMLPAKIRAASTINNHIDLPSLCARAQVELCIDSALWLDAKRQIVHSATGKQLAYDFLSINVGANSSCLYADGIGIKPLWQFYKILPQLNSPAKIAIIGAGAAGIELACALKHRSPAAQIALYNRSAHILPSYPAQLGVWARAYAAKLGIKFFDNTAVHNIADNMIYSSMGAASYAQIIYCTGASPSNFIADLPLEHCEQGFIKVKPSLQSYNYANIFAAGDCATLDSHQHPKAGVFAVRHAKILYKNLHALSCGAELSHYQPQKTFLSILDLGKNYAIGNKGKLCMHGKYLWHYKQYLDKKFVNSFN